LGWAIDLLPVEEAVRGLGISEIRRLKQLEEENRKLKPLVADLSLDKLMLQNVLPKNYQAWAPARARSIPRVMEWTQAITPIWISFLSRSPQRRFARRLPDISFREGARWRTREINWTDI
jgi:hypothetical protein